MGELAVSLAKRARHSALVQAVRGRPDLTIEQLEALLADRDYGDELSQITVDSYQVAGIADHITPWQSNYRSTHLLGSQPRFVLSTSGHIAAIVNPPDNPKASYRVAVEGEHDDPESWLAAAEKRPLLSCRERNCKIDELRRE
mgnify:CR=1 FL=1